jgi:hypothetical protein
VLCGCEMVRREKERSSLISQFIKIISLLQTEPRLRLACLLTPGTVHTAGAWASLASQGNILCISHLKELNHRSLLGVEADGSVVCLFCLCGLCQQNVFIQIPSLETSSDSGCCSHTTLLYPETSSLLCCFFTPKRCYGI